MGHPLEDVIKGADGFVLIGDSSQEFFPATSYAAYVAVGKSFHCYDMGGLKESRGKAAGGPVYSAVEDLPADRSDLAVIWVKPRRAKEAVEVAIAAGCKRVWFSFHAGHRDAVAHAREQGLEVVEIGRCPVYYLPTAQLPAVCRWHARMTRWTGTRGKAPQLDAEAKRRELW